MAFTFFFRDLHVLELVAEHVAPGLLGRSYPKVWDAGCAMGPEPYSLAMVLAEKMGFFAFNNLRLDATDLDDCQTFGPIIARAVYQDPDLDRIPQYYRQKYFEPGDEPGTSRVIERIRGRVKFTRHDLLSLRPIGSDFHLIMCKNVLLHLTAAERTEVIRMFQNALAPGGYLAMEQTQKLPEELSVAFERVVSDGQLYKKVAA